MTIDWTMEPWDHGPWDRSVSFWWIQYLHQTKQSDSSLNCLAFSTSPPLASPACSGTALPSDPEHSTGLYRHWHILAFVINTFCSIISDSFVISEYVLIRTTSPVNIRIKIVFLKLGRISFHFKFPASASSSSLAPMGERDLTWTNSQEIGSRTEPV